METELPLEAVCRVQEACSAHTPARRFSKVVERPAKSFIRVNPPASRGQMIELIQSIEVPPGFTGAGAEEAEPQLLPLAAQLQMKELESRKFATRGKSHQALGNEVLLLGRVD